MKQIFTLTVNGEKHEVLADPCEPLVRVIRFGLGLTGTKEGCGTGDCGACTVLLDGRPVCSCLLLVAQAKGKEITTIEGISNGVKLHPLQQAFIDHGAVQCGFCTPGMLLSAKGLLDENPRPTELEVREAIAGNLCRCTGYVKIVKAILACGQA